MKISAIDPNDSLGTGNDRGRAIGAILVDTGRLRQIDVEEIQRVASNSGMRFGDAAIQLNLITQEDVELALSRQFNYPVLTHGQGQAVADEVIAAYDHSSQVVEELRTIRSRLTLGWLRAADRRVLAITSPQRGDGRSWFSANLAIVFAQAGERTLLIDTDMRRPQQHRLFNIENKSGLSELLTGRAGKEVAQRIDPKLRLFVVPTGAIPPNPQELLGGTFFDVVVDGFRKHFDIVILDTAAAAETSDAEVVAARAGAAIMLSRRHHTRHAKLLAAMLNLTRSGVQVIGSVVNEF
jgi:protein-tyrosine kinase